MSARVFNPLVMAEMRRMIGRSNSDVGGRPAAVARVKRDLFGPVNHEDAQSFVDRELAAIRKRESEQWGFDFEKMVPLDNPRFRWERVTPEENLPEAYAQRRLSFLGRQSDSNDQRTKEISVTTATTTTASQSTTTTTQKSKPIINKQPQITDYLKCRKRSFSAGDISVRKVGSGGDISSLKVGTSSTLSEPSKRKRSKTRQ